ncbi:hypothetical protein WJX77_005952 [Trebouxia sp. C0004]
MREVMQDVKDLFDQDMTADAKKLMQQHSLGLPQMTPLQGFGFVLPVAILAFASVRATFLEPMQELLEFMTLRDLEQHPDASLIELDAAWKRHGSKAVDKQTLQNFARKATADAIAYAAEASMTSEPESRSKSAAQRAFLPAHINDYPRTNGGIVRVSNGMGVAHQLHRGSSREGVMVYANRAGRRDFVSIKSPGTEVWLAQLQLLFCVSSKKGAPNVGKPVVLATSSAAGGDSVLKGTQVTQGLRTLQAETPLEAPPAEAPGPEGGFLPSPWPELSISPTPAQDGGTCVTLLDCPPDLYCNFGGRCSSMINSSPEGSSPAMGGESCFTPDDCTGFLNANVANSVCNLVGQCCYGLPTNHSGCRGNGDCFPGLVCTYTAKAAYATCMQPVATGQACGARLDGQIDAIAVCGPEDTCENEVCTAVLTNAPCSLRADCGSGQTCNTARECTAPIPRQGNCTSSDDCAFNCDCGDSGLCELTSDFDYGYETALCNTTDDCPVPSSCNSSYQCEEPFTALSSAPATTAPATPEYQSQAQRGGACVTSLDCDMYSYLYCDISGHCSPMIAHYQWGGGGSCFTPGDCASLLSASVANSVCNTADQCSYGNQLGLYGCRGNADCFPGLVCTYTAKQAYARCVQPVPTGQACGPRLNGQIDEIVVCGPEDTCQNGVCNAVATNASCSSRANCGSGQTCNTAGECTAPVPQQGACATSDDCAFNCDCGKAGLCELIFDFDYGWEVALCNTTVDCPVPGYCDSSYRCNMNSFPQGRGGCYSDRDCPERGAYSICDGTDPATTQCSFPVEANGDCDSTDQCDEGLICSNAICAAAPANLPCTNSSVCAHGSICDSSGFCDLPGHPGVSCVLDGDCGTDLCTNGTCVRRIASGQTCIEGDPCDFGLICRADLGSTCAFPSYAGDVCQSTAVCQTGLQCVSGRCTAPLSFGAACTQADQCASGSVCNGQSVCAEAIAIGGSCQATADCAIQAVCSSGQCTGVSAGAACVSTDQCGNGFVCNSSSICSLPAPMYGPCGISGDCESGLTCYSNHACYIPSPDGSFCSVSGECQTTSFCNITAYEWESECTPLLSAGSKCNDNDECVSDLVCDSQNECETPQAVGSDCNSTADCELEDRCEQGVCAVGGLSTTCFTTEDCGNGLVCNSANTCQLPMERYSPCNASADCASFYTCRDGNAYQEQGTNVSWVPSLICDLPQADGYSCYDAVDCAARLVCTSGSMCAVGQARGATCKLSADCVLGDRCTNMACAAGPPSGSPCTTPDDCGNGLACNHANTCQTPAGLQAPCNASADCASYLSCQDTTVSDTFGDYWEVQACTTPFPDGDSCGEPGKSSSVMYLPVLLVNHDSYGRATSCSCSQRSTCNSSFACAPPLTTGEPCQQNVDCTSDLVCSSSNICTVGQALGASCSSTADCLPGDRCTDKTCAAGAAVSSACATSDDCGNGQACNYANTCQMPLTYNSSCNASGDCAQPLSCSVSNGDLCLPPNQEGDTCAGSGDCSRSMVCNSSHLCSPALPAGGQCLTLDDCAGDLVCNSQNVCADGEAVGAHCSATVDCVQQSRCSASTCIAVANQATCTSTASCGNGFVCNHLQQCALPQGLGMSCNITADCGYNNTCITYFSYGDWVDGGNQSYCQFLGTPGDFCDTSDECIDNAPCIENACGGPESSPEPEKSPSPEVMPNGMPSAGSPEEPVVPSSSPSPGSNITEGDLIPVVTSRQTLSGYSPASFNLLVQQQFQTALSSNIQALTNSSVSVTIPLFTAGANISSVVVTTKVAFLNAQRSSAQVYVSVLTGSNSAAIFGPAFPAVTVDVASVGTSYTLSAGLPDTSGAPEATASPEVSPSPGELVYPSPPPPPPPPPPLVLAKVTSAAEVPAVASAQTLSAYTVATFTQDVKNQFVATLTANIEKLSGSPVTVTVDSVTAGSVKIATTVAFLSGDSSSASTYTSVLKSGDVSSVFGTSFGGIAVDASSVKSATVTNPSPSSAAMAVSMSLATAAAAAIAVLLCTTVSI